MKKKISVDFYIVGYMLEHRIGFIYFILFLILETKELKERKIFTILKKKIILQNFTKKKPNLNQFWVFL
jgi:hypothetical protein